MDTFVEYIVQRRKDAKDRLIIFGIVLLGAALTLVLLSLSRLLGSFTLLFVAALWYGAYHLITSRSIEFEYAVTNGELDVDEIIARRRRKRIISVRPKEFELIAPVGDEKYAREFNNVNIKRIIDASSNNSQRTRYFALFRKDGELVKLVFEPTEKMLNIFKTYKPQNVFFTSEHEGEGA